jgi:hypothetical protein
VDLLCKSAAKRRWSGAKTWYVPAGKAVNSRWCLSLKIWMPVSMANFEKGPELL